ncbi:Chitinase [uncultured Candidatus Thioglobus sp.]|nr:Chitinase [uncultured Candidatus Thioglobus sp.]
MSIQQLFTAPRHLIAATLLLLSGSLFSVSAQADSHEYFVTEWNMNTANFVFPGSGDYTINWGDGSATNVIGAIVNNINSYPTHRYSPAGTYTITVSRGITQFEMYNIAMVERRKLTNVSQWGTANWASMERAFIGADNMRMSADDNPNLSSVVSMKEMFFPGTGNTPNNVFNGNISGWDVSNVRNMESMFRGAKSFNQDLSSWNVSNVMNMRRMFRSATAFNSDISGWNVNNVSNISEMLESASAFNQNLGRWYVSDSTTASATPTLATQSTGLTSQSRTYTLVAGNGDTDNTLFKAIISNNNLILTTEAQTLDNTYATTKTYSLRIGVSADFGTENEVAITVTSSGPKNNRVYAISISTGLLAEAQAVVLNAVLPQLLRASTKIAVDNISNRIDQALDAPASASTAASFNIDGSSSFQQLINSSVRSAALKNKPDLRQLFNNASFLVPLNIAGDNNGAKNMTLWGSGDYLKFEDNNSGVDSAGKVVGASIGIDTRLNKDLVAGAAVSYTKGDADYTNADTNGTLINTQTSIHPYVGYDLADIGRVWGTFGYGKGEVELTEGTTSSTRDTKLTSFAFGGNRQLLSGTDWLERAGTTTLRVKGEISLSNIDVDAAGSAAALSIDANRYRVTLEGSHKETLSNGTILNPSLELGIRYDDNGSNNGNSSGGGVELAAGYRYNNPQGLVLEVRTHGLLTHKSDYQEWGINGLVKYQANINGQGLWLSMQPSFGDTPGNVADRTWDNATITDEINGKTNSLRLNTELGYGLPGFFGRGLLTHYTGLNVANNASSYNIGTRWAIDSSMNLNLVGNLKKAGDSIQLRGDFKF